MNEFDKEVPQQDLNTEENSPKKNKLPVLIAAAAVVILVCLGIFLLPKLMGGEENQESTNAMSESITPAVLEETNPEETTLEETEEEVLVQPDIEKIGLITDHGMITTGSYNQLSWQGIQEITAKYQIPSSVYEPQADTYEARLDMVIQAIEEGCDVIVVSGYKFGKVIAVCQRDYPDVYFIGNAISAESFSIDGTNPSTPAENVVCITHAEAQAGYMAGYAAVADGYTKLGFLATTPAASIVRYGNGFLQGADAAANELGLTDEILVRCVYAESQPDVTVAQIAEKWYAEGTEVIFQIGGNHMGEMVELCKKYSTKVIASDTDCAYLDPCVVTSAVKDIQKSVFVVLEDLISGKWNAYGGMHQILMLEDGDFVGLPAFEATWRFQNFTIEEYQKVKEEMKTGERTCLTDTDAAFGYTIELAWE